MICASAGYQVVKPGEHWAPIRPHYPRDVASGRNIILVGEMRDSETAEMGIQASLDWTLGFQYNYIRDGARAITRMVDMGCPPIWWQQHHCHPGAASVRLVCPKCKQPYRPTDSVLEAAGIPHELADKASFMKGKGCSNCNKTGYRGRQGILRADADDFANSRTLLPGGEHAGYRKAAVAQGCTPLSGRYPKAVRGITNDRRSVPSSKRKTSDAAMDPAPVPKMGLAIRAGSPLAKARGRGWSMAGNDPEATGSGLQPASDFPIFQSDPSANVRAMPADLQFCRSGAIIARRNGHSRPEFGFAPLGGSRSKRFLSRCCDRSLHQTGSSVQGQSSRVSPAVAHDATPVSPTSGSRVWARC